MPQTKVASVTCIALADSIIHALGVRALTHKELREHVGTPDGRKRPTDDQVDDEVNILGQRGLLRCYRADDDSIKLRLTLCGQRVRSENAKPHKERDTLFVERVYGLCNQPLTDDDRSILRSIVEWEASLESVGSPSTTTKRLAQNHGIDNDDTFTKILDSCHRLERHSLIRDSREGWVATLAGERLALAGRHPQPCDEDIVWDEQARNIARKAHFHVAQFADEILRELFLLGDAGDKTLSTEDLQRSLHPSEYVRSALSHLYDKKWVSAHQSSIDHRSPYRWALTESGVERVEEISRSSSKTCGAQHPLFPQANCLEPAGHEGVHMGHGGDVQGAVWGGGRVTALDVLLELGAQPLSLEALEERLGCTPGLVGAIVDQGLAVHVGTGAHPVLRLTEAGRAYVMSAAEEFCVPEPDEVPTITRIVKVIDVGGTPPTATLQEQLAGSFEADIAGDADRQVAIARKLADCLYQSVSVEMRVSEPDESGIVQTIEVVKVGSVAAEDNDATAADALVGSI